MEGGIIHACVNAPDGGYYAAGRFSSIGSKSQGNLAKFKADGTLDSSFNPIGVFDGEIRAIALQKDGKVVIGGKFSNINGLSYNNIARFNKNGTLDTTFNIGSGFDNGIHAIVQQADGRLIVGGAFQQFNGTECDLITRLNPNGSRDSSFSYSGALTEVYALTLLPNGKILVGGYASYETTPPAKGLVRLNSDGTNDSTFKFNPAGATCYSIAVQADGKILVGGSISYTIVDRSENDTTGIVRLNADGSKDTTFYCNTGKKSVNDIALQKNGNIVIAGPFDRCNTVYNKDGLARLKPDGTNDTSFKSKWGNVAGTLSVGGINRITMQADGHIIVAGYFRSNRIPVAKLVHLKNTGSIDTARIIPSFKIPAKASMSVSTETGFWVGGDFGFINGVARNRIAKLKADGSLDTSFDPGTGCDDTINDIVAQNDGKVIIGGTFSTYNGAAQNKIARLNANGTLDTSFNPANSYLSIYRIDALVMQNDGRIIIIGAILQLNETYSLIIRLNANGSLDSSFDTSGISHGINALALRPDGRILVGSSYSENTIRLLNTNGTMESSFKWDLQLSSSRVNAIAVQKDGRILAGGTMQTANGSLGFIKRLNSDGTIDTTFKTGTGFDGFVQAICLQPDGKILVGGDFDRFNGAACQPIARLNSNGSLDPTFKVRDLMAGSLVTQINLISDGRLVMAAQGNEFGDYTDSGFGANAKNTLQLGMAVLKADNP